MSVSSESSNVPRRGAAATPAGGDDTSAAAVPADRTANDRTATDRSATDRLATDHPVADRTASDHPVADRAATDRAGHGRHTLDTDRTDRPADADRVAPVDRASVVAREKERYGGIKWGSAFFGWLTATGTAVILTALLLAAGAAVGVATRTNLTEARTEVGQNAGELGVAGGLTLLIVLLISYYCGGYVAGRMARFNGARQGVAVWIWAIVIAVLVAVAVAVLGDQYDVLDRVGGFPRLPVGGDDATAGSVVALVIGLIAALVGAILGGLAGMRFHRKVDRAGLER
ncbi:hypothetical protein [Actinoplanes sp. NPDC049265]|uniref:hypothetical protein n=1 Tax=Actinoplanes sp. NPDC049265 TaxID=3363902 RepID=UPI00371F2582